jgi:endo-1,4-beta-xylanase
MVTPENVMKWPIIHPDRSRYDFGPADALVSFAHLHQMAVRGHNLLTGGTSTASWVLNGHFSRDQLMAIVQQHITTVVSHFRGQVTQWDVVNEALDATGNLGANVWSQGIGPDYMDLAFRWAHAADPEALLFYNEDDIACDICSGDFPARFEQHRDDAIYNLVAGMKQRGVPIDGVGLQMHLWAVPPDHANVTSLMDRLRRIGVQVAITEMDVRLPDVHTAADLDRQAEVYATVLGLCLSAPNCRTFVVWGFSDATSWVPRFIQGYGRPTSTTPTTVPSPRSLRSSGSWPARER